MLLGHSHIAKYFDAVMKQGTIAHAYAFVGPDFLGKKTLAMQVAAQLLGTTPDRLSLHPDFHLVEQEMNQKTDKLKKNIDIDQVRAIRSAVGQTSTSGFSVVIIDGADRLNLSGKNALLKTLEEPRGQTVFFLIARNIDNLGETICSRCQVFQFAPVSSAVLREYAQSFTSDMTLVDEMVSRCQGFPGLLVSWLQNPEQYQAYQETRQQFLSLFSVPFFAKRQIVEDLFGDAADHIQAREELVQTLEIWEKTMVEMVHSGESLPSSNLVDAYDRIGEAKQMLTQNIHPRVLLEQILLALP